MSSCVVVILKALTVLVPFAFLAYALTAGMQARSLELQKNADTCKPFALVHDYRIDGRVVCLDADGGYQLKPVPQ